ncbi:MAG: GNAT family N-acetyltransferase [Oscillospiraceae bacterium]|nr:GNAT family N-acetyltransferase [Oscillospiraceae bacterium]
MIEYKWSEAGEPYIDANAIRKEVFCDEQKYPVEAEFDELDKISPHLTVYKDGVPVGTGRIVYVDEKTCHIGRIAVKKARRGEGIGRLVVEELLRRVKEENIPIVTIEAQTHAAPFYEKLGFKIVSHDIIYDLHIPHYKMIFTFGE